ncbi:SET and MYND domain-containing protein 4 [Culex quinquefasciatus]|uniref:SET and MYND domain-containing protein 4 n=1 Tax=Culex quinquefasciatus TaxID=7176 RepID=UPI0018E2A472|nr:SET and MYND domain-containing protein 4 [Culex quinquefasciatus]
MEEEYGHFPKNAIGTMIRKMLTMLDEHEIGPKLSVCYNFVLKHEALLTNVPEPVKNNDRAVQLRQQGNRLYQAKRYENALEKYNESICYAEAGSDQLAMGYANRSAIYFEQGEYEFALLNIRLARDHNYPEKLRDKLDTREKNCRLKIGEGLAKDNVPCPRLGINVEINPKIPCLAKGIAMKQYSGSGRGLVAERNFKAGDVILNEKAILSVVAVAFKYLYCSRCGIPNQHSLIPCPNCVHCMYCSEECLAEDSRMAHRYECSFGAQMANIAYDGSNLATKLFFYGLTLFNNDLDQMMKYCEKNSMIGADPFKLDHRNYDPLEEFKIFHETKLHLSPYIEVSFRLCAAATYYVLLKQPLIKALVTTKAQKRSLLNCLYLYQRVAMYFAWERKSPPDCTVTGLLSYGKLVNHSCNPNAMILYDYGQIKCILIRPVRKGQQITISLGPAWFVIGNQQASDLSFTCQCEVCLYGRVGEWIKTGKALPAKALKDLELCTEVMLNEKINDAAKLNAYQQIIQRYDQYLPNMDMSYHLRMYYHKLTQAIMKENIQLNRAKVAAAVV